MEPVCGNVVSITSHVPEENVFIRATTDRARHRFRRLNNYMIGARDSCAIVRTHVKLYSILDHVDCVTMLRDPYERFISDYYMFHYDDYQMSFYDWVSRNMDSLPIAINVQTQWLGPSYEEAIETVDHCVTGVTEHFTEFVRYLPNSHLHLNVVELHENSAESRHHLKDPRGLKFADRMQLDYAL